MQEKKSWRVGFDISVAALAGSAVRSGSVDMRAYFAVTCYLLFPLEISLDRVCIRGSV